jgi:hypothetical protein
MIPLKNIANKTVKIEFTSKSNYSNRYSTTSLLLAFSISAEKAKNRHEQLTSPILLSTPIACSSTGSSICFKDTTIYFGFSLKKKISKKEHIKENL